MLPAFNEGNRPQLPSESEINGEAGEDPEPAEAGEKGGGRREAQPGRGRPRGCALRGGGGGAQHMERLVRVPCGLYPGAPHGVTLPLGPPGLPQHKHFEWRQHVGAPTFLARPRLLVPANASAYCGDPYKRTQLKAILSHMNPSLSLRLCKAPSKEVGVQVSLRVDKAVQCSLGPRTLRSRSPWGPEAPLPAWGGCSPGMGRRARIRLREDGDDADSKAPSRLAEAGQQPPLPTSRSPADRQEELRPRGPSWEEEASSPGERKATPAPGGAASPPRKSAFQVNRVPLC